MIKVVDKVLAMVKKDGMGELINQTSQVIDLEYDEMDGFIEGLVRVKKKLVNTDLSIKQVRWRLA